MGLLARPFIALCDYDAGLGPVHTRVLKYSDQQSSVDLPGQII